MNDIKKKSFYLLILAVFLSVPGAFAQSTVVSGTIIDGQDKNPLPYVTVSFKGSRIVTKTDGNGKYTLSSVTPYTQLQVNYVGFKTRILPVVPSTSQTLHIRLQV
jgi:hypothetical protein